MICINTGAFYHCSSGWVAVAHALPSPGPQKYLRNLAGFVLISPFSQADLGYTWKLSINTFSVTAKHLLIRECQAYLHRIWQVIRNHAESGAYNDDATIRRYLSRRWLKNWLGQLPRYQEILLGRKCSFYEYCCFCRRFQIQKLRSPERLSSSLSRQQVVEPRPKPGPAVSPSEIVKS